MDNKSSDKTKRNCGKNRKKDRVEEAEEQEELQVLQVDADRIKSTIQKLRHRVQHLQAENNIIRGQLQIVELFKNLFYTNPQGHVMSGEFELNSEVEMLLWELGGKNEKEIPPSQMAMKERAN